MQPIHKRRIKERREQLDMTQEQLGAAVGKSQKLISRYEIGDTDPTGKVWDKLADALDTTVDYLLGRTDNPDRPLKSEMDLDEVEKEVIKILRSKKPSERKRVMEIMKLA